MRRWRFFFVLIGTLLATGARAPGQDPLAAVFARIDAAASRFKGLAANIRRVDHEEVIHEEDVETGTIKVKRQRPKELLVRMDIQGTNPKQAVVNGSKVQVYYPNNPGEIQVLELGKKKSLVDQYMALGFGGSSNDLRAAYVINLGGPETVAGEATTRLELTPKSSELLDQWKRIDLWISDKGGYAAQQKFYEKARNYILITYTNVELNPTIPDSVFHLDVPKGTKQEILLRKK
ncbi:MAG: outer-membrane lipoprotein carrier protein LolA [Bryobacteraceae bacterium]|jgi:outer membrane lipoprotein-sorting protein